MVATRRDVEQAVLGCGIKPLGRLVVLTLLTYADGGPETVPAGMSPAFTTLVSDCGLARSATAAYLTYLENLGWVTRSRPGRTTRHDRTTYAVHVGHDDPDWMQVARGNRPSVSADVRRKVFDRDGHRCVGCGSADDLTLDHIKPWSQGGPTTEENLRVLCRPCNSRKGPRDLEQG